MTTLDKVREMQRETREHKQRAERIQAEIHARMATVFKPLLQAFDELKGLPTIYPRTTTPWPPEAGQPVPPPMLYGDLFRVTEFSLVTTGEAPGPTFDARIQQNGGPRGGWTLTVDDDETHVEFAIECLQIHAAAVLAPCHEP